jgi:HipA-like C-terminal domain
MAAWPFSRRVNTVFDQAPDQVIDISNWPLDEEFGIFPVGSKPKRAVFCPMPAPFPFLIAGHRYLFKVSKAWRILQHWSEVAAYALAHAVKMDAARCFIAVDNQAGEVGVLVEFFYGHPGRKDFPRLISGADLLRRKVEDYEADPDRHHTLTNILALGQAFSIDDRLASWGRFLSFDALIGNTDRHPENWGYLATKVGKDDWTFRFAPSFDHGTSLAYQVRNEDIKGESSDERIQHHIKRGRHHARWSDTNPERGHVSLCGLFAQAYPQALSAMLGTLEFNINSVNELLARFTRFDLPDGAWNDDRGAYLSRLISARRKALTEALGG